MQKITIAFCTFFCMAHVYGTKTNNNIFIEAICAGYNNNPSIRSSLRELFAQSEAISLAKSGFLPNVSLFVNGNKTISKSKSKNTITKQKIEQGGFGVSVTQSIYKGNRQLNAVAQADKNVKAAMMDFVGLEQKALLEAIEVYANLWQAYEILKLRDTSVKFNKRNLEEVKTQVALGEKSRTELAEASAQLAGAISNKINSQADVLSAKAKYEKIISIKAPEYEKMIPPYCVLQLKDVPKKLLDLQKITLQDSPTVKSNMYRMHATKSATHISKGEFLPSVGMSLKSERNFTEILKTNKSGLENKSSVLLEVKVPIFQGGKEWSGLRKSYQKQYKAVNDYRKAKLDAQETATSSWYLWKAAMNYVKQVGHQVKSAKINLEGKKQEYLVGEIHLTLFLEAEQKWVAARINQIKGRVNYITKFYQLLSVYGGLLPDKLNLPIERYKVDKYIKEVSNKFFGIGNLQQSLLNRDIK